MSLGSYIRAAILTGHSFAAAITPLTLNRRKRRRSSSNYCALAPIIYAAGANNLRPPARSEEHTSELQSLMRISYAVFCLKKQKYTQNNTKAEAINSRHATINK